MNGVMGGGPNMMPPQMTPPMGSPQGPNEEMRRNPPRMSRNIRPDISASRMSSTMNDAVNVRDNYEKINKSRRPEMKGPSELDDILSGLKTKKINIKSDEKSVVSISELEDMKDSLEKPKKSRRKKPKSERNAISLNFN